jgi:NAD(P)-dependent dehydrogenase (short-subunit alcohol dehydrogenase family)
MASEERRVAIVTGGGRGIGKASALRLAQDGRDIVIADVGEYGEEAAREVADLGVRAIAVHADVADEESVRAMVDRVMSEFGRLDILVNCAGILGLEKPFHEQTNENWHRVLAINLTGVWNCCQAVIPAMRERGYGRIVTISSGASRGAPNVPPYGVTKAGVKALMGAIARTYAKENIFANCVEPGRALTDMVVPRFSAEFLANPPGVPIGRYSSADEVAVVVNFLCSEENTYISGSTYKVNGGAG